MTRASRKLNAVLRSTTFIFLTGAAAVVGVVLNIWPGTARYWFYVIPIAVFLSGVVFSLVIRLENQAYRSCARLLHEINHSYRDVLCDVLGEQTNLAPESLPKVERETLEAVCQRIAGIFTALTAKQCVVTVKLITSENDKLLCSTLARSELNSERDRRIVKYEINTGNNPAFDTALKPTNGISHYFSADLIKEEKMKRYCNQRADWKRFYRSAIVVPIRNVHYNKLGEAQACDELGFLTVDTLARNHLNDGFHLEYLAAFADQMFNFMSLMRGKYQLKESPESKQ